MPEDGNRPNPVIRGMWLYVLKVLKQSYRWPALTNTNVLVSVSGFRVTRTRTSSNNNQAGNNEQEDYGEHTMKPSHLLGAICACIVIQSCNRANASILTFDDITTYYSDYVPNGYGGLNWSNMIVVAPITGSTSGYVNGLVSGEYVAFNGNANLADASGNIFDFNGAYLTAAWNNGLSVNIKGYLGTSLLYDTTVNPSYYHPTWYQFDFLGVDKLELTSFGGVDANTADSGSGFQFVMDNFTYSTVPIPQTVWLLGSGLLALISTARRKLYH